MALCAALISGLTGLAVWTLKPDAPRQPSRTLITPPTDASLLPHAVSVDIAISPDGTRIVYRGSQAGQAYLFVRAVSQLGVTPLAGLGDPQGPFFSPDGNWVGFFDRGGLYKVSINGGPPVMITKALDGVPRGATWGPDDTIIFASTGPGGLRQVAAEGGEPEEITALDPQKAVDHLWPEFLPGGGAVLFTAAPRVSIAPAQLVVLSLDSRQTKVLVSGGSNPRYVPTGHIVYGTGDTLRAVGFDVDRLEVTSGPIPVAEDVITKRSGAVNFGVARSGSAVFVRGDHELGLTTLAWRYHDGREEPLNLPADNYSWPRISPDGTRVALGIRNEDVWVLELARGTLNRMTTTPGTDNVPLWTDSERVVFASLREQDGKFSFFEQRADGTGAAEKLLTSPASGNFRPWGWSPDGMTMIFDYGSPPALDIGVFTMRGDRKWEPLLQSEANEAAPALSPNGQWIAYSSDQTSQCEIYIEGFPNLGSRRRISTRGGAEALWSRNGREVFYREDGRMMSVSIDFSRGPEPGTPKVVFEGLSSVPDCLRRSYDLSPDGKRFLILKPASRSAWTREPIDLVLVQNFFEELKHLVEIK